MKNLVVTITTVFLLLFAAGCNEQEKIDNIRAGQVSAALVAGALFTAVNAMHVGGRITDAQWLQFDNLYGLYKAADSTLAAGLGAWEAGVGKPPLTRITAFLANLNGIVDSINALIKSWKVVTAEQIPHIDPLKGVA